ncbi:glycoside hydrolase family 32 protein [Neobacillus bataviensis]|uniref:glycoside hydrolase family 32 protein n=1 Tax=Neobacillus bataviensis TaxID=220685 RepID=UPI0011A89B83|nr:glycoside hydrolase family 32 protein [Neobacillus bataviensis]
MSSILSTAVALGLIIGNTTASPVYAENGNYKETYRPQFHYTPEKNWMNDPNGLVYYKGEYHLFYQYNPSGNTWGNMSWGHAVSRNLVHWTQLPVAIPQDVHEMVFSGSAVVDTNNTTGFGKPGNPALVAIYTSADKVTGKQSQALAYSTDGGRTFTKYAGNPVLDIGSSNFRDPKVFWYEPGHEWLMTVAQSDQHKVSFYSSPDLKHWKHLSDFGPAGATGGVWECPDLFQLPDPSKPGKQKWVLIVNLNPGGVAGGSGAQYFIGNFNGTTFTSDDKPYTAPSGENLGNFDNGTFDGWTASGTAFGDSPAIGSLPGQMPVAGWGGSGFVNSFHNYDGSTGTLSSPNFTINKDYLNFLIGGGNHPHVDGGTTAPPSGQVFEDFEGTSLPGWTGSGDFVGIVPTRENLSGQLGNQVLDTCQTASCDGAEGTVTSPTFTINSNYIDFLISGGNHPISSGHPTVLNLVIDGSVVASATGNNSANLDWQYFDVSKYQGKQATLQIVDQNDGSSGWGHLMIDNIVFSDVKAEPWDTETGVNLLVNGQVVRSATGQDSESLDWTHWNVHNLLGKTAHIEISDQNTSGWGHILADQFTMADEPAHSNVERAHWVDYGKDNYAAVTYNDAPGGKRIMIGWMNNWQYGGDIPTSPWRSAMTVPRELKLQETNGKLQLVQMPVKQLNELREGPTVHFENIKIPEGTTPLSAKGKAVEINATFLAGSAKNYGLKLRTGNGQETEVGYDSTTEEVYIDRTQSGDVNFSSDFPGIQRAPLAIKDGKLKLKILVDWSSIEVFAEDGEVVLTDQIFPDPSSDGMAVFATGGTAHLQSFTVNQLRSVWND